MTLQDRMERLGVRESDLRVLVSRASGPGGQHVNKVSTAVEVTHLPSGTSATAGDSRSQHANRAVALLRLVEKLETACAAAAQERRAAISKRRRQRARRSAATKRKLVEGKRRRGETKQLRKKVQ